MDNFYWLDFDEETYGKHDHSENYQALINWAVSARGQNPLAFDEITQWILDDDKWSGDKLSENRLTLMGLLARFKEQNAKIRSCLESVKPSGIASGAVFTALDRFDAGLSGGIDSQPFSKAVSAMLNDFSVMSDANVRRQIAGGKTGPQGTDAVEVYGYINCLKELDAGVQWALFMPRMVESQQKGFKVESFEYKKLPTMRFIGVEAVNGEAPDSAVFAALDALKDYKTSLNFDALFSHHNGLGVDVSRCHNYWGRFMSIDAPAPDGFACFDFIPKRDGAEFAPSAPFLSQFAYAVFGGDMDALHSHEGFDGNAMYDVTRNIILGQGVNIPYPDKYWTAEAFLQGADKPSTAFLFSVEL